LIDGFIVLCCLLAALFSGNLAVAGRLAFGLARRPSALKVMILAALAGGGALLAPVAIAHAGHYAERARLHDRSILEEILVAPICSGAANDGTHR
jgi:hypothetical protein